VDTLAGDVEDAAAARAGVDISGDADLGYLRGLTEKARARRAKVRPAGFDPRKVLRALTKKLERQLRREWRREEVAFRGRRTASRKSREAWRRDEKRDEAILSEIKGFFAVDVGVRMVSSQGALVHAEKSSPPKGLPEAVMVFPHWEKSSELLRAFGMASAAGLRGARDFTIHMNDAVLSYASGADGKSFAKRMLRRINDALKAKCAPLGLATPDVMFFVEKGRGERPHLHGIITLPDHPDAIAIIRAGLKQAAGSPWKSMLAVDTQVDIGGLSEPVGWLDYITKFKEFTKASLGSNTFAASLGMRACGRDWYEHGRRSGRLILPRKAVPLL